jgi:hypothetical protein
MLDVLAMWGFAELETINRIAGEAAKAPAQGDDMYVHTTHLAPGPLPGTVMLVAEEKVVS